MLDAQAIPDPRPVDALLADLEEYLLERKANGGPAPFENVTR